VIELRKILARLAQSSRQSASQLNVSSPQVLVQEPADHYHEYSEEVQSALIDCLILCSLLIVILTPLSDNNIIECLHSFDTILVTARLSHGLE
jgi:ABC-type transport system involved in cytochrome bd biosynthesis fused ATPase/permease subunit